MARSIAYLCTFTAQERTDGPDLSQTLLEALVAHPDPATRGFAEWALNFRFGPNGEVRSLLYAQRRA